MLTRIYLSYIIKQKGVFYMTNDLKTRERLTTTVNIEVAKILRDLSKETMIPISKLVEKALISLLQEYGKSFDPK